MSTPMYYVRSRGKITGPYELKKLHLLRERGQLARFHEISEDRRTWFPASTLDELFPSATRPVATPSPADPPITAEAAGGGHYEAIGHMSAEGLQSSASKSLGKWAAGFAAALAIIGTSAAATIWLAGEARDPSDVVAARPAVSRSGGLSPEEASQAPANEPEDAASLEKDPSDKDLRKDGVQAKDESDDAPLAKKDPPAPNQEKSKPDDATVPKKDPPNQEKSKPDDATVPKKDPPAPNQEKSDPGDAPVAKKDPAESRPDKAAPASAAIAAARRMLTGTWDANNLTLTIEANGKGTALTIVRDSTTVTALFGYFEVTLKDGKPRAAFEFTTASGAVPFDFTFAPGANPNELLGREAEGRVKPNPLTFKRRTTTESRPAKIDLATFLKEKAGKWVGGGVKLDIEADGNGWARVVTREGADLSISGSRFKVTPKNDMLVIAFRVGSGTRLRDYKFTVMPGAKVDELILKEASDLVMPNPLTMKREK